MMKEESSSGNQSVDALISVGPTLTPASNGVNAGLLQIPDGNFEAFCLEKERKITGTGQSTHSNQALAQLVEKCA
jgi:hypothetical protein